MKKLILILFVFCSMNIFSQDREWHVKPLANNFVNPVGADGTSFGKAWCLQYALSGGGGQIQPGDIVWLHGDLQATYTGVPMSKYVGRFECTLSGASDLMPITVSSYPGEWAVIDGNTDNILFQPELFTMANPCVIVNGVASLPPISEEGQPGPSDLYPGTGGTGGGGDNDPEESDPYILDVKGSFVTFKNFEVTCLGQINRIHDYCNSSNGFEGMIGINHGPPEESPSKCKFINLIVRNIPGTGIGSWKYTLDSEIYGCLLYNNGYVRRADTLCGNPTNEFAVYGKGPGIYTQNTTSSTRKIDNNFIMNNYDSGVLVWSATEFPSLDFVKNYEIKDNVLINNGNPGRRHTNLDNSPGFDSKPNLIIDSYSKDPLLNKPTNINVNNNIFYVNSRSSFVSGVRVKNSRDVSIHDNYFFKGTTMGIFPGEYAPMHLNSQDLSVKNNFYLGKYLQIIIQPTQYGTQNWDFDHNTYYGLFEDVFQYSNTLRRNITAFRADYPIESEQNSSYFVSTNFPAFGRDCLVPQYSVPHFPVLNKIVQNVYDPNKFYVTMNNSTLAASRFVSFNGFNDTSSQSLNGKSYVIRDPQNYFAIVSSGSYDVTTGISFPLNLNVLENPIGFFDHCLEHSYAELSTFVVEFGCSAIPYDITTTLGQTDNSTINYRAQNQIIFGNNYIANIAAIIDARAEKSIVFLPNTHIKSGSKLLAKIENVCVDVAYNESLARSGDQNVSASEKPNSENTNMAELVSIYPNPSSGIFKIESTTGLHINHVIISNINNAQKVFEGDYKNQNIVDIDITKQPVGLYTVEMVFEDNTTASKIIIKN